MYHRLLFSVSDSDIFPSGSTFLFYEPAIEIKKYVYSHFYTKELMFFKLFNDIFHLHWLKNKVDMFTRFGV